jgi:ferredoxin-type protein NapG
MAHNPHKPAARLSRRQFIGETAKVACSAGLIGLALGLHAQRAKALPASVLRPPGARPEPDFLSACVRCGLCVRDCPFPTLSLAKFGDGPAIGTPFFVARKVPCEMCDDIPCVKACPTDALDPGLTDIDKARMGLAVLVDQETCLNFKGLRCDVCYRICPLIDKAITLEREPNRRTGLHARFLPTVHSKHCTGCGKCERACVLEEAAINVLPRKIAKGKRQAHYRYGWPGEKGRARPVLPGIRVPTPRLPPGKPPKGAP